MPLQIRRGTTAQRFSIVPLSGEPIYDTDLQTVFIGDGVTQGGVAAISGITAEDAQDAVGQMFVDGAHKNIIFNYGPFQDAANRIDVELDLQNYDGEISAAAFRGPLFADDSSLIIDSLTKNIIANSIEGDLKGSVFADSSGLLVDAVNNAINLDGTVKGDVIPDQNEQYDLGSNTNRFRDLYLSGNSLYLGSAQISSTNTEINLPAGILNLGSAQITSTGSAINLPAGSTVGGIGIGTGSGNGSGFSEFVFKVAADDSTQILVTNGNTVQFVGGLNIETLVDNDGVVTIRTDSTNLNADTITTGRITSEDSSPVRVNVPLIMETNCTIEDNLTVLGDLSVQETINATELNANTISTTDISANNIQVSNDISANTVQAEIVTSTIRSDDSSQISIIHPIRMETFCTIDDDLTVQGKINGRDIIPDQDGFYDLGSNTNRFRDLYLSGNVDSAVVTATSVDATSVDATSVTTQFIDGSGSGVVTVRTALDIESDLTVQNDLSVRNDITAQGRIFTDTISPSSGPTLSVTSQLQVNDRTFINNSSNIAFNDLEITRHTDFTLTSSRLALLKSRGTADQPSAVINGDIIGIFGTGAYDGSNYRPTASISTRVAGPVSPGIVPSQMIFSVNDNSGVLREAAVFDTSLSLILSRNSATDNVIVIRTAHDVNNNGSNVIFTRSRNTTASPTAVIQNDSIIDLVFTGHDGTIPRAASIITPAVDGPVSAGIVPGRIDFSTTNTSGNTSIRMSLRNNGVLKVDNIESLNGSLSIIGDLIGSVFADNSSMIVNGTDGSLMYYPSTPSDWSGTAPSTVGEALDRLAFVVKSLNSGTGA